MLKICSKCQISKDSTEFSINNTKPGGLSGTCKECHKIESKNHYEKNKKDYLKRNEIKRKEIKQIVNEAKSVPCSDCGKSYPSYVMDFDHIQQDKEFNLAHHNKKGKNQVLTEISKCEVVCSNCHRIRTWKRSH